MDNNGNNRRICASRSLGTSSNASRPVGDTGGNCGHTGEKRSARRVLFQDDGVTGGLYLGVVHTYKHKRKHRAYRNRAITAIVDIFFGDLFGLRNNVTV